MDDHDCHEKLVARRLALKGLEEFTAPLSYYAPADRARIEALSRTYRALDRAITAHVVRRGEVRAGGSVLVPTRDRLDFVELDAATLRPRALCPGDDGRDIHCYLPPGPAGP